ncbi:complex I intermediate-associated protein 30-domain-containing protein [Dipodascopsis tothii]|uniref:complex I intermediate-associated protein 30-domain-containing protein n=1 Tax=Dipodascopsis tothii TaxID=44089 RepID=UPI0034CDD874
MSRLLSGLRGVWRNNVFPETIKQMTLLDMKSPADLSRCITRSDKEIMGYSEAFLDFDEKTQSTHFHGTLSLDLPPAHTNVQRSGYAMFRTQNPDRTFRGKELFWDWQSLSHVALRVKGDRRKYFVNIQADTALPTEIYQHRLFLNSPGEWETVVIPIDDFLLTNWGIVENIVTMNKSRVRTIGIGILDRRYGPFSLYVDWIKVINQETVAALIRERQTAELERMKRAAGTEKTAADEKGPDVTL